MPFEADHDLNEFQALFMARSPMDVRVRCVRADDHSPMPGARVTLLRRTKGRHPRHFELLEHRLQCGGVVFEADENGELRLESVKPGDSLGAQTEDLVAAPTHVITGELTLVLSPWRRLEVLLVDPGGNPRSGVPVVLRSSFHGAEMDFERVRSDESGRAFLALNSLDLLRSLPVLRAATTVRVAVAGYFREAIEQLIDIGDEPAEAMCFVVPDSGRCLVRLLPKGIAVGGSVSLSGHGLSRRRPDEVVADQVEFEPVALGQTLAIAFHPPAYSAIEAQCQTFPGPMRDGEVVVVDFDLDARPRRRVLAGRLIHPDGTPLVHRPLRFVVPNLDLPSRFVQPPGFRSDEKGCLAVGLRSSIVRQLDDGGVYLVAQSPLGSVLTHLLSAAELDGDPDELKDIVLEAAPRMLAGRVLDQDDQPRQDVGLQLLRVADGSRKRWVGRFGAVHATTDEQGRFEFRDEADAERILITAIGADGSQTTFEALPGDLDIVIRLARR